MRDYGKVETKFWGWALKNKLSNDARTLALYLLTGPHSNSIGCYRLPDGYITADLGLTSETITDALSELSKNGFAHRCKITDFLFLPDYLRHNKPENPNVGSSMARLADTIPSDFSYGLELTEKLKPFGKRLPTGFVNGLGNRFETLTLTYPLPEPNQPDPPSPPEGGDDAPKEDEIEEPETKAEKARKLEAAFDAWYESIPPGYKKGRGQARRAFPKALAKTDLETLKAGILRYHREQDTLDQPADKRKHPSTWLNGECWLDDVAGQAPTQTTFDRDKCIKALFETGRWRDEWGERPTDQELADWKQGNGQAPPPDDVVITPPPPPPDEPNDEKWKAF